jgi:hypothetical protein
MRWGAALCLVALGCGAAAPRASSPEGGRETLHAVSGWNWDTADDCDGGVGCLDWMPEPRDGWSIYGYVLERESRRPVADATVIAIAMKNGRSSSVQTNGLGQFAFERLAAGRYHVTIVRGDARDQWPDVVLEPRKRTALRIHIASDEK